MSPVELSGHSTPLSPRHRLSYSPPPTPTTADQCHLDVMLLAIWSVRSCNRDYKLEARPKSHLYATGATILMSRGDSSPERFTLCAMIWFKAGRCCSTHSTNAAMNVPRR